MIIYKNHLRPWKQRTACDMAFLTSQIWVKLSISIVAHVSHHRVHTEWQWPLSGVYSIMMVKSALPLSLYQLSRASCGVGSSWEGRYTTPISPNPNLKVWWQDATLFVYFWFYNIHTFIQSQYIHPSSFAEASLHILIACVLSGENFPVVPSRESNSGLPYSKPTRCQLSHAAPLTEPRRTILSHAAPNQAL
jgi:hypothetical protein